MLKELQNNLYKNIIKFLFVCAVITCNPLLFSGEQYYDSNSNITLSQIGTDVGGSMSEDKTYMYQTDFSSGNDLAAGDFIIFCIHTNSLSSTSYPRFNITLELQYT